MRYDDDTHEARIQALEARLAAVEAALLRSTPAAPQAAAPLRTTPPAPVDEPAAVPPMMPPAPPLAPRTRVRRQRPPVDLEQLLGGKLFAWVGGVAILVGVVFFVATAIHRGWIGEGLRVGLGFLGASALLVVGLWLHERRGQTQASLVAIGTAIAALYACLVAGTNVYDLIGPELGLFVAALIGTVAMLTAIRLASVHVAGLGIVGALLAPVLVDAGASGASLVFMGIALTASTGVLLWQRWDWLALISYVVSAPQLARWVLDQDAGNVTLALVVLGVFWLLYVTAALGYEIRVPTAALRPSSAVLAVSNVLFTAGVGWAFLDDKGYGHGATAWVIALALVHIGAGALVALRMRETREIPLLFVACGIGLSAVGLALALDGSALVAGWSVEAVILAWLSQRLSSRRALVGSFGFLALAGTIALQIALGDDYASSIDAGSRIAALLVVAIAAAGCAYFLRGAEEVTQASLVLELAAATLVLLALPIALDGGRLVAALAFGAVLLAGAGAMWSHQAAALAGAGWAFVGLGHALAFEAQPHQALIDGLSAGNAIVLGIAVAGVVGTAVLSLDVLGVDDENRLVVLAGAGVVLLYGLSALIVAAIPAGGGSTDGKGLALSAFWSLVGVGLLIGGLAREVRAVRLAGIALLSLAIAKVFLYDLAKLGSLTRVGSFIALGVLLLVAAYAYQRQTGKDAA